jgi:hypothetical protein
MSSVLNAVDLSLLPQIEDSVAVCETHISDLIGFSVTLKIEADERNINLSKLQLMVCTYFKVKWDEIIGKSRKRHIVEARHSYCYVARRIFNQTATSVAKSINRDHTSVIHATQTMDDLMFTKYEPVYTNVQKIIQITITDRIETQSSMLNSIQKLAEKVTNKQHEVAA